MQHSDPFDRVTGRGWVVSGEGDSEILPGTGRGTACEAGGGGVQASGPDLEAGITRTYHPPIRWSPSPKGEDQKQFS